MREEMENEKLDSFQDFLFFLFGGGGGFKQSTIQHSN